MIDLRSQARNRESIVIAAVLAFGVVGWQQWVHSVALGVHSESGSSHVFHWLRDGTLALLPALVAVAGGLWIAARVGRADRAAGTLFWRSACIAGLFAILLVPMVAVHSAIDRVIGGDGGLGTIKPAPGAGYLLAGESGGLESAGGFLGQLGHGA